MLVPNLGSVPEMAVSKIFFLPGGSKPEKCQEANTNPLSPESSAGTGVARPKQSGRSREGKFPDPR